MDVTSKPNEIFLVCFFKGYFSENHITSFWFEQIQYFFKWKELTSYVSAHERLDIDMLSEEEKGPLELMRNWLLNDKPWDGLSEMLEILKDYEKVLPSNFDKSQFLV